MLGALPFSARKSFPLRIWIVPSLGKSQHARDSISVEGICGYEQGIC
jgi:hypothetical protein